MAIRIAFKMTTISSRIMKQDLRIKRILWLQ